MFQEKSFGRSFGSKPSNIFSSVVKPANGVQAVIQEEDVVKEMEELQIQDVPSIRYSNEELLDVKESKDAEEWAEYAKNRAEWDTKNAPFEFDAELRGKSVAEQLVINREREKQHLRQRQEDLGIKKKNEAAPSYRVVPPSCVVGEVPPQPIKCDFPANPLDVLKSLIEAAKKKK